MEVGKGGSGKLRPSYRRGVAGAKRAESEWRLLLRGTIASVSSAVQKTTCYKKLASRLRG